MSSRRRGVLLPELLLSLASESGPGRGARGRGRAGGFRTGARRWRRLPAGSLARGRTLPLSFIRLGRLGGRSGPACCMACSSSLPSPPSPRLACSSSLPSPPPSPRLACAAARRAGPAARTAVLCWAVRKARDAPRATGLIWRGQGGAGAGAFEVQ